MSETESSSKKGGSGRAIGYTVFAIVVLAIIYWGATAYQERQARSTVPVAEEAMPEAEAATPKAEAAMPEAEAATPEAEAAMPEAEAEAEATMPEAEAAMPEATPEPEAPGFDSRELDGNPFTF